jgi:hypothetical protein
MPKRKTETVIDLGRYLDPLDMDATLVAVIEVSQSSYPSSNALTQCPDCVSQSRSDNCQSVGY